MAISQFSLMNDDKYGLGKIFLIAKNQPDTGNITS